MRRAAAFASLAALAAMSWGVPTRAAAPDSAAPGGPSDHAAALIERARVSRLAGEREWRRLLHHPPGGGSRTTSHVDDPDFFLAPDGRTDPVAELEATLRGLFAAPEVEASEASPAAAADPPGANPHPRCRFVARERWLRERLGLDAAVVPSGCTGYHRWRATLDAHSVTLIFPAAYLNNPSSMFGHTLLRLDPKDVATGSDWLSWSINFAADTGGDAVQGLRYAWKGITGGYPGRFSLEPYFTKLRDYGAIENRDIWEYPLDLGPAEVERLVEHLWELRDVRFDYFFFRENCSFRLLELLEHARPSLDLVSGFPLTAIPADTVRAVAAAGLIEGSRWLPSTATLLRHELRTLPDAARPWIETLAAEPAAGSDERFLALAPEVRTKTVNAANRLLTYRTRRAPRTPERAERRLGMLSLLASQPDAGGGAGIAPPAPSSPDTGHDTSFASLGAGRDDGVGHVELAVRASYHDLLDPPAGYVPGAGISLGELTIRADGDDGARVESFALLGIRSLAPGVPGLASPSWGVDVGLVRDEAVERGRLMLRVGALAGLSRELGGGLGYALAGPSFDAVDRAGDAGLDARANAHARLGLLGHGRFGATRAELGADSLQGRSLRLVAELAHDLPFGPNRSVRAGGRVSELDGVRREEATVALRVRF